MVIGGVVHGKRICAWSLLIKYSLYDIEDENGFRKNMVKIIHVCSINKNKEKKVEERKNERKLNREKNMYFRQL